MHSKPESIRIMDVLTSVRNQAVVNIAVVVVVVIIIFAVIIIIIYYCILLFK